MSSKPFPRQHLEKYLETAFGLVNEYEQELMLNPDPMPRAYAKVRIEKFKEAASIAQELLDNPLKPLTELPKLPGFEEEIKSLPPVFTVPQPRPEPFVGRLDLIQAVKAQLIGGGNKALAALDGKPGVGKTTLALYLAWESEVQEHFWGGVLWTSLGFNASFDYQLRRWLEVLGGNPNQATNTEVLLSKIQVALQGRACLFIIDDVWQREHAQLFKRVVGPGCAMLLTSRDAPLARSFAPQALHRVEELPEAEAVTLLQELCPQEAKSDKAALQRIIRAVGGLPLALSLIAGYLSDNVSFKAEAQQAFDHLQAAQNWLGLVEDRERYLKLQQVVELSLQALPEEAQRAFTGLAAFAAKPASFSLTAAKTITQVDDPSIFGGLVRRNLLEKAEGGEERLALHQVLGATAWQQATEQKIMVKLQQRHTQYYLELTNSDRKNWQNIEPEWLQIVQAWERLQWSDGNEKLTLNYIEALGEFQKLRGLWREGLKWSERGLEVIRNASDPQNKAQLVHNQAWYYNALGEHKKALDYYQQALSLFRVVGDRIGEAFTLTGIGKVYSDLGETAKALDYYEQALPLLGAVDDPAGEAYTLKQIGLVYAELGEPTKALTYYQQALALWKAEDNQRGEAQTLNNIGLAYADLDKLDIALDYYQQALPLWKAEGDRAGEAFTLNLIGQVYYELEEPAKALTYYEQALPLRLAVDSLRDGVSTFHHIAAAYADLGEPVKALDYYERVLPLQQDDHKGKAYTLNHIGKIYASQGELAKALDYYQQALDLQQIVNDSADRATTFNNIGLIYADLGELAKALDYYRQALDLQRKAGNQRDEATTLNNIGLVHATLGEKIEALTYLELALPLRRLVNDRKGEAATLNNMGKIYADLGNRNEAVECYELALPLRRAVNDRKGEAYTLNNIGRIYSDEGDKAKALDYYQEALFLQRAVADRKGQAATLNNIGNIYFDQGDKGKALDCYRQALPLRKAVSDRKGEAKTLYDTGWVYWELGRREKGVALVKQAETLWRKVQSSEAQIAAQTLAQWRAELEQKKS
jgi:tetratricopeptide (TPR) repeat protein